MLGVQNNIKNVNMLMICTTFFLFLIDEEMVNLIQFQHSYNASAKVISTIDSLLDVVVNGLVR